MRVRMLTSVAGTPAYAFGDVVDLAPHIATAWVAEGMAALVREESTDTADAPPQGERAVAAPGRRRRGA